MEIKVLGTGCPRCKALEQVTRQAVQDLGVNANVSKVEDIEGIVNFGVMRTPALVINDRVVLSGRVPDAKELKDIITKNID
ncbi:MAG: thioredoxin family protein [Bacteroidales bacterium]